VGYKQKELGKLEGPKKLRFMESIIQSKICEIEGLSAHADQKGCSIGFRIRK
jgi:hypothetical protein